MQVRPLLDEASITLHETPSFQGMQRLVGRGACGTRAWCPCKRAWVPRQPSPPVTLPPLAMKRVGCDRDTIEHCGSVWRRCFYCRTREKQTAATVARRRTRCTRCTRRRRRRHSIAPSAHNDNNSTSFSPHTQTHNLTHKHIGNARSTFDMAPTAEGRLAAAAAAQRSERAV